MPTLVPLIKSEGVVVPQPVDLRTVPRSGSAPCAGSALGAHFAHPYGHASAHPGGVARGGSGSSWFLPVFLNPIYLSRIFGAPAIHSSPGFFYQCSCVPLPRRLPDCLLAGQKWVISIIHYFVCDGYISIEASCTHGVECASLLGGIRRTLWVSRRNAGL